MYELLICKQLLRYLAIMCMYFLFSILYSSVGTCVRYYMYSFLNDVCSGMSNELCCKFVLMYPLVIYVRSTAVLNKECRKGFVLQLIIFIISSLDLSVTESINVIFILLSKENLYCNCLLCTPQCMHTHTHCRLTFFTIAS